MKQQLTVDQLEQRVRQIEVAKHDYLAPFGRLHTSVVEQQVVPQADTPNGSGNILDEVLEATKEAAAKEERVELQLGSRGYHIQDHVHGQIHSAIGMHGSYYRKCLKEDPELLTINVNRWFDRRGAENRLVRAVNNDVRAFLSPKYRTLDNIGLVHACLPALREAGAEIESAAVTNTRLYIKAFHPTVERAIKVGDVVRSGVLIRNSETGCGKIAVIPMVLRLVCMNGMTVNDASFQKVHLGRTQKGVEQIQEFISDESKALEDAAVYSMLGDVVRAAFDQTSFDKIIDKWAETTDRELPDKPLDDIMDVTRRTFDLSVSEADSVLTNLAMSGDMTQWGLGNAVTRHAQHKDLSYDRATELEAIGGKIVEVPKVKWENIFKEAA
jgi:hypothetical protein